MMKFLRYAMTTVLLTLAVQMAVAAPQDVSAEQNPRNYKEMRGDDQRRSERGERHRHMQIENGEIRRGNRGRGDWKIGAPIPDDYRFADYAIDATQYPKLSAPSRYQQWIKVDNRFILINVITNTTLKVVPE